MFNLFRSQKQAVRLFLGAILITVAFSMVITLIPGLMSNTPVAQTPVLGEIDGYQITVRAVDAHMRSRAVRPQLPLQTIRQSAFASLNYLITEQALILEAEQLGIAPTEQEIAAWLKFQLPFLFPDGVFVGRVTYARYLRESFERTISEFEADLKRALIVDTRLKRLVTSSVIVTLEEAEKAFHIRNDQAKIEFVKISPEDFRRSVRPSEQELKEHYEKNKSRYQIAQKRTLKLLSIRGEDLPVAEVSDTETRLYYSENRLNFRKPERIKASHILFMTMEKPEDEAAAIEAKAQEILKQIHEGGDFAALAREHSEDSGSGAKGGDLGWFGRGQMVPEFENAAFAMKADEVSDLVKSEFGFHIIKLFDREEARTRPYQEAREEIRESIAGERQATARIRFVDQVMTAARKAGADLESVAAEFNLAVRMIEGAVRAEPPEELVDSPELVASLFRAKEGEPLSSMQEDRTTIAVVAKIEPRRPGEFGEVRVRVREDLVKARSEQSATGRADEVAAAVKKRGGFRGAAARWGLRPKTSELFKRSDFIPDVGTAGVLGADLFRKEVGAIVGPVNVRGSHVVFRIVEQKRADSIDFETERDALLGGIRNAKATSAFNLYRKIVTKRYEQAGKVRRYMERLDEFARVYHRPGPLE